MNSSFATIAASTDTFRSKPYSGWPHIMRLPATGTSSNETTLVLITLPLGQIFAAQLTGLRFRAYHPGTLSVFSTPVSNFLELREMTGISALRLTPESGVFEFEIQSGFNQGTELIFSSHSISVSPSTSVCNGQWQLIADKEFTHFVSESTDNAEANSLRVAWSIVGGSYVHRFIERVGNKLNIFSYHKPDTSIAALVERPQKPEEYAVLAPQTFESVYSHLAGFSANERNEFYAIIPLYLDAKRTGVAVEGSVLNIFSFLEARDGSKTMSWQTLQTMLNLTRDEAEFIVAVRNAFGHGSKILSAAIVDKRGRIVSGLSRCPRLVYM
jgi:hypothetical protein